MVLRHWLYRFFHQEHHAQGQAWRTGAICPLCKRKTAVFEAVHFCSQCGAKFANGIATPHPETDPMMRVVPVQFPNTGPIAPIASEKAAIQLPPGYLMKLHRAISEERHGAPVSSDTLRLQAIHLQQPKQQ